MYLLYICNQKELFICIDSVEHVKYHLLCFIKCFVLDVLILNDSTVDLYLHIKRLCFADPVYATNYYCAEGRGVTVPHLYSYCKKKKKSKVDLYLYLMESKLPTCCVACCVFFPLLFFFFWFSSGVELCSTLYNSLNVTNDNL